MKKCLLLQIITLFVWFLTIHSKFSIPFEQLKHSWPNDEKDCHKYSRKMSLADLQTTMLIKLCSLALDLSQTLGRSLRNLIDFSSRMPEQRRCNFGRLQPYLVVGIIIKSAFNRFSLFVHIKSETFSWIVLLCVCFRSNVKWQFGLLGRTVGGGSGLGHSIRW